MTHDVILYAQAVIRDVDGSRAWIDLHCFGKVYEISMHEHYLVENDLFEKGRWFDFRIVRIDGEVDLELSRRPDLEDNIWKKQARQIDLNYLDG